MVFIVIAFLLSDTGTGLQILDAFPTEKRLPTDGRTRYLNMSTPESSSAG
jgi:hypothetical protein